MSDATKIRAFMIAVTVVTFLVLLQGFMADGSKRVIPLIFGALGAASLAMWAYALRSSGSKRKP
ncbi:hypothetical protein [Streptomyces sp. NPDC047829]|uniref:hypothetical protein n=1 Tax=Streptomyces sp. NPDC047829 TaxID=3154609 RepID=UPI00340BE239